MNLQHLDPQSHDLAVRMVAPESQSDPRVPTAEEFDLWARVQIARSRRSRLQCGWLHFPQLKMVAPRSLQIRGGEALLPSAAEYRLMLPETTLEIPALPSAATVIHQRDRLWLVAVVAEVGAAQDSVLGAVVFSYLEGDPPNETLIETVPKENTRRWRSFWLLVLSPDELSAEDFYTALPLDDGHIGTAPSRSLTIVNTAPTGFPLGNLQLYAADPHWVSATYAVLPGGVDILPLCQIQRRQNFVHRGYTWGLNGEGDLESAFAIAPGGKRLEGDLTSAVRTRLQALFSGTAGIGATDNRTVQNLSAGAVPGNPGRAGEAAASPNGSVALANDQRLTFTNEARLHQLAVQVAIAGNDGQGNALVSASLNTNAPFGSRFSEDASDHKLYASDGSEQSALGRFQNLGGSGSLVWVAGPNATLAAGQTVYVVPGIHYPAGSGFNVPFSAVEAVWKDGAVLDPTNIRHAYTADLDGYEAPANGEDFMVVYGPERAALQYIYKKVSVTADANGVAAIPTSERGCFAFIEGVTGRIDAPVKTGLTANATTNALVYYPPRSLESWQLQLRYSEYQGLGETDLVDGALILSEPIGFIHSQGGGNSVFVGDSSLRFSPIAMHLPAVSDGTPAHAFNAPMQLAGEPAVGPLTFRPHAFLPGAGLAFPTPGQTLSVIPGAKDQPRSLNGQLQTSGQPLGFRTPSLSHGLPYQAILAFAIEKAGVRALVVATHNGPGGDIALDSDRQSAIDVFVL